MPESPPSILASPTSAKLLQLQTISPLGVFGDVTPDDWEEDSSALILHPYATKTKTRMGLSKIIRTEDDGWFNAQEVATHDIPMWFERQVWETCSHRLYAY